MRGTSRPRACSESVIVITVDGHTVAGPTAVDGSDKRDWSVRPAARDEVLAKAAAMHPPLAGLEPVFAYAGLRPAGARGANYVLGPSRVRPGVIHAAAIRSTGLSASLGIGEHVAELIAPGRPLRPLPEVPPPPAGPKDSIARLYMAEAAKDDEAIGVLMRTLDETGLRDRTTLRWFVAGSGGPEGWASPRCAATVIGKAESQPRSRVTLAPLDRSR